MRSTIKAEARASFSYAHTVIPNLYLRLEQNPWTLLIYLFFKCPSLQFGFYHSNPTRALKGVLKALFITGQLIQKQLGIAKASEVIYLPIEGHLCLKGHSSFTIFDFAKQQITKQLSPDAQATYLKHLMDQDVLAQHLCLKASAPDLRLGSAYQDKSIQGYALKTFGWSALQKAFDQHFLALLKRLIAAEPAQTISLPTYLDQLGQHLNQTFKELEATQGPATVLRDFVRANQTALQDFGLEQVILVVSHGDFQGQNILKTSSGTELIDWETLGYRSAFYDLFYLFDEELFLRRIFRNYPPSKTYPSAFQACIHKALKELAAEPSLRDAELDNHAHAYFKLFLLERLHHDLRYRLFLGQDKARIFKDWTEHLSTLKRYEQEVFRLPAGHTLKNLMPLALLLAPQLENLSWALWCL